MIDRGNVVSKGKAELYRMQNIIHLESRAQYPCFCGKQALVCGQKPLSQGALGVGQSIQVRVN